MSYIVVTDPDEVHWFRVLDVSWRNGFKAMGRSQTTWHYKLRLIQIKFSFTVKTIDFWSYLKVFTGIKKKKSLENFFSVVRKFFFGLLIFMYMK